MSQLRVLISRQLPEKFLASLRAQVQQRLPQHPSPLEIVAWHSASQPADRDFLLAEAGRIDGLLCLLTDRIDAELLGRVDTGRFRVLSTLSVGVDHVDLAACRRLGVRVGHTPGVLTEGTADLALALLLATARRLPAAMDIARRPGAWGPWTPFDRQVCGRGLQGAAVGIVGFGRIGQAVARRLAGFGPARLLYTGPRAKPEAAAPLGAEFVADFHGLLAQSDFVVVCCPGTPGTRHLFDAAAFARMRPDSILINVSRGTVVNQADLHDALASGRIGAAGLDVTDPEPLPSDSPLLALPNCLVLPHIGSADLRTREAMTQLAVDNLVAGLCGGAMPAELRLPDL